jgi:putative transposase
MDLARILAYVTGTVDQELLTRNEYLAAENRILKTQLKGRLKLSDTEGSTQTVPWRLLHLAAAHFGWMAAPNAIEPCRESPDRIHLRA